MDSTSPRFTRLRDRLARWRRVSARTPTRSQQELCETAMALLTLWVSFDDTEHESVARTTRTLLTGLTAPDMGYLVLHMAGLTRGLVHSMADSAQGALDLDLALQALARGVQERGAAGREE